MGWMILRKEFYFIRHGQTDHNISEGKEKGDHHGDIPLNATGRNQAAAIEHMIALLPILTICTSRSLKSKQILSKMFYTLLMRLERRSSSATDDSRV